MNRPTILSQAGCQPLASKGETVSSLVLNALAHRGENDGWERWGPQVGKSGLRGQDLPSVVRFPATIATENSSL